MKSRKFSLVDPCKTDPPWDSRSKGVGGRDDSKLVTIRVTEDGIETVDRLQTVEQRTIVTGVDYRCKWVL